MGILKEFKEFAMRGSVIDLAVGVIVGGAFQKIVSSFVTDIITPPISAISGTGNFADRSWKLSPDSLGAAPITLNYGRFIQNVVDFVLVAFVIFLMVKGINALRRRYQPDPEAKPAASAEEKLLTEIRDLLKARSDERSR